MKQQGHKKETLGIIIHARFMPPYAMSNAIKGNVEIFPGDNMAANKLMQNSKELKRLELHIEKTVYEYFKTLKEGGKL